MADNERDDGEASLRREVADAAADEEQRADRLFDRWRRFARTLHDLADGGRRGPD